MILICSTVDTAQITFLQNNSLAYREAQGLAHSLYRTSANH